jgi:hypothetical protein
MTQAKAPPLTAPLPTSIIATAGFNFVFFAIEIGVQRASKPAMKFLPSSL